jgi:hypothetical protein
MTDEVERRADLALHIGLLTEHELTRVLQMLDAVQEKLGVENHEASELADLEMETRPEDVLAEIARLQHSALANKPPDRTTSLDTQRSLHSPLFSATKPPSVNRLNKSRPWGESCTRDGVA